MTISPEHELQQHSDRLKQQIIAEISGNGLMPFDRYMDLALYAPRLGYYSAGMHKFGKQGDFITAPEISPLFAYCIAHQVQQIFIQGDINNILEFGAGTGKLAADILTELNRQDCLPEHYYILEVSADLKERQQHFLQNHLPHLYDRITWLSELPKKLNSVIIANEVVDAMAVSRFRITDQSIDELYVNTQNNHLELCWSSITTNGLSQAIETRVKTLSQLAKPYESEVNLRVKGWINSLANIEGTTVALIIDYGYPSSSYYHPDRSMGTLSCYHQQQTNSDPLWNPGLQDITAHVDFSAVAYIAHDAQFTIAGYTSQALFLLSNGLDQLVQREMQQTTDHINLIQGVKTLTLPTAMGERFQVLALSKNYTGTVQGFNMRNNLGNL